VAKFWKFFDNRD